MPLKDLTALAFLLVVYVAESGVRAEVVDKTLEVDKTEMETQLEDDQRLVEGETEDETA